MLQRISGALLFLAALTACSDGGSSSEQTAVSFNTIAPSTTPGTLPGGSTTTTVPPITYTIVRGDSLYRIADQFCTVPADIVMVNDWSEGLSHVIYPGDVIVIPPPGCPVESVPSEATTSTTIVSNKYLDLYLNEHVITNPFDPHTGDHKDWGPVCYHAYWTAHGFAALGTTKADLLAALDPLPGNIAPSVLSSIDLWVPFSTKWFPVYTDVYGRIQAEHPMYPNTENFYRALYTDPEYLTLLTAYESVGTEQFAAKYWVTDLCSNLMNTRNSTP